MTFFPWIVCDMISQPVRIFSRKKSADSYAKKIHGFVATLHQINQVDGYTHIVLQSWDKKDGVIQQNKED